MLQTDAGSPHPRLQRSFFYNRSYAHGRRWKCTCTYMIRGFRRLKVTYSRCFVRHRGGSHLLHPRERVTPADLMTVVLSVQRRIAPPLLLRLRLLHLPLGAKANFCMQALEGLIDATLGRAEVFGRTKEGCSIRDPAHRVFVCSYHSLTSLIHGVTRTETLARARL